MDNLIPGHSQGGPSVNCQDCARDCVFAGTLNSCTCPRHLRTCKDSPEANLNGACAAMVGLCTDSLQGTCTDMNNRLWAAFYAGREYEARLCMPDPAAAKFVENQFRRYDNSVRNGPDGGSWACPSVGQDKEAYTRIRDWLSGILQRLRSLQLKDGKCECDGCVARRANADLHVPQQ